MAFSAVALWMLRHTPLGEVHLSPSWAVLRKYTVKLFLETFNASQAAGLKLCSLAAPYLIGLLFQ